MVTHRPREPRQPESCLSSPRRRVAEVQHRQDRVPVPGWGLCNPRCECPTASPLLMCIWKREPLFIPTNGREEGAAGEGRKKQELCFKTQRLLQLLDSLSPCLHTLCTSPSILLILFLFTKCSINSLKTGR